MCCGDKEMHGHHAGHIGHGAHHRGMAHGMCSCGGERRFLSRKEKIEMLEEYKESLKSELEGLHSVEVSFNRDVPQSDLSGLHDVESVERMGDKFKLYAREPAEVIYNLVDYARSEKVEILSLVTISPTLEDVFIKYTEAT